MVFALMCSFVACSNISDSTICGICGKKVSGNALFCSNCGSSLDNQTTPENDESSTASSGPTEPDDVLQYPAENADWKYDVYTSYVVLTQYKGNSEEVAIPEMLEGLPVAELRASTVASKDNGCFSRNETIKKVILTENIKRIGGFEYSTIENVVFANDDYIEFDSHTFYGCDNIKNVKTIIAHMPAAEYFPSIFQESDSSALNSIVIPDRFEIIDSFAFLGCSKLQQIDVGNVSKIDTGAFKGTLLGKITIHNKNCEIDLNLLGDYCEFGDLIISAPAGSTAAQFASQFSLEFELIP